MWAIAELSLRKMREGAFFMLVLAGLCFCVITDNADPITSQVANNTFASFALSGQGVEIPPVTMGSCVALLLCVLLTVFYGSSEIPKDVDTGLIMVLLSKPVTRLQYLAGKYIAILIMSFGIYFCAEVVLVLSNKIFGSGTVNYTFALIARQFLPALLLFPLVGLTVFFSALAGSMGSMILTTLYILFSVPASLMPLAVAVFPDGMMGGLDMVIKIVSLLFPNFFFYLQDGINGAFLVGSLFIYTLSISVLFAIMTIIRLARMDLSAGTR